MGISRLSETFLGDISDFSPRTGWSAVFSSCCVAALQACETSRLGPPLPDFRSGRVLNDFLQRIFRVFGFRELDRDQFFLDRRDYGEFIAVDDGLLLIFSQESHRGC